MKEAYGQLYEIETSLRDFIQHRMAEEYGPIWYHIACSKILRFSWRRPFEHIYLYDLEIFLHRFPCFSDLPKDFIPALRKIYPIRNKIAHCHKLTENEFSILYESYIRILEIVKEPVAKQHVW